MPRLTGSRALQHRQQCPRGGHVRMADLLGESEPEENLDAYLIDGGSETKDE